MPTRCVVVLAESDPVARGVGERFGALPAANGHVEGATLRQLAEGIVVLRRPGPHVHDEALDERFPASLRADRPVVLFPSIHRSSNGPVCFTVHALGNWGDDVEVGGRPRRLVPAPARWMTALLRGLAEGAWRLGLAATYEATHHGPSLGLPAAFVEVGGGPQPDRPSPEQLALIAQVLRGASAVDGGRVAVGVGGGHYVPHFTDLALRREWSFGHLIPRHALDALSPELARAAREMTEGAEGFLFARAADAERAAFAGTGDRLREQSAPRR